jgi:hypothetical protein
MRYLKETAKDDQIAFEDTPDGALALKFHRAIRDQYGGENAAVPLEDVLAACAWLLIEVLVQEPSESRQLIVTRLGDEVLRRLDDLGGPAELRSCFPCASQPLFLGSGDWSNSS